MKTITNALRKTPSLIQIGVVVLFAGGAGYWLRGHSPNDGTVLAAVSMVPVDYFIPPESFSRIQNAKATLEGLCDRLRLEVQCKRLADQSLSPAELAASGQMSEPHLASAIRDLERGMREAEGSGQELLFAQDLFFALKKAGRDDRWLEVYLNAAYEHPMHPVIARFAPEAVSRSRAVGRQDEVLAGLRHLIAIPLEFQGKDLIQAALLEMQPDYELTRLHAPLLSLNR